VTWLDPELDDGGAADCSPPEPELAELLFEEPCDAVLLPCVADDDAVAGVAPARLQAMPPPASTLAAPMAAVTARSRPWPRSRAATAARTFSLPVSTLQTVPSAVGRALSLPGTARMPGLLLRGLCCGCGAPVNRDVRDTGPAATSSTAAVDVVVDDPVESRGGQGINGRCPVDD
jgi:hypothetical protein